MRDFFTLDPKLLFYGFTIIFFANFGQTFFISLFNAEIRNFFNLTDGEFGLIYALGTVTSSLILVGFAKLIDHMDLRIYSFMISLGLAIACLSMYVEYESIISQEISNSNLIITDFKVSKVPALAQLLTLASLQGIADTLSGEGIRFKSFEMKSNSKENVMNIEDALAIGPAVSILLEGYVNKGKTVSLRGTLVPATKLNAIIASIPLVGDILVGKKTGEGVVGVSFKMKGPLKDIKTTVNPIKTLTPRFIVRAIEKMKKKKKKEAK